MGFNRCPYQLLRSYKRHKENKRKIRQERSSMQQADYQCHRPTPWMQESVSMHKSPTPLRHSRKNQARSEEEEKERNRVRKNKGQEADRKKGSPTKQKHIWGTKTRPYDAICLNDLSRHILTFKIIQHLKSLEPYSITLNVYFIIIYYYYIIGR